MKGGKAAGKPDAADGATSADRRGGLYGGEMAARQVCSADSGVAEVARF